LSTVIDRFSSRKLANRRRAPALLVILCAGWIVATCGAPAEAQSVWGLKPYHILILTAFAPEPEFTPRLQHDLRTGLVDRSDVAVGAAWRIRVESARFQPATGDAPQDGQLELPPELARSMLASLDSITVESLPKKLRNKFDKIILMTITKEPDCSRVTAREFDTQTQLASTIVSRQAWQLAKLRDVAFNTVLDAFAPLALIEQVKAGQVKLWLKASSLPPRDPSVKLVAKGDAFRPVMRYEHRDGSPKSVTPIQWSYLMVEKVLGGKVDSKLITGLRSPLAGRRRGRVRQLALAIVPPHAPSTLVLQTRTKQTEAKLRRYTTVQPADDWQNRHFDDSKWKQGLGASGARTSSATTARHGKAMRDVWIRRTFTLDEIPTNSELTVHRAENASIYINGELAATVIGNTMDSLTVPINIKALKSLKTGELNGEKEKNVIAIHCWQASSGQYVDAGIVEVLPGYDVFSRRPDSPATTLIGRSDWKGRVAVPPAANVVRVLILKNGGALLARLPIVPGLQPTFVAEISNDDVRLEAEGIITGLQEELVDLVTQREIFIHRSKKRIERGEFDEALKLIDELDRFPKADEFLRSRLKPERDKIVKKLTSKDMVKKVEKLFDDTEKAVRQFLGREKIEALRDELNQARKKAGKKKAGAGKKTAEK